MTEPSQKEKRVVIKLPEKRHADFKVRLRYDEMSQTAFYRAVTEAYISQDELFLQFLENYKKKSGAYSAHKKRRLVIDKQEREQNVKNFALGSDDIESIYDLVEKEHPDI